MHCIGTKYNLILTSHGVNNAPKYQRKKCGKLICTDRQTDRLHSLVLVVEFLAGDVIVKENIHGRATIK